MRILMVNLVGLEHPSGSNQHQLGLMQAWLAMGHEVRMLSPAGGMAVVPERCRGRIRSTPRLSALLPVPPSLDTLAQIPALVAEAVRFHPDVVYARVNVLTFVLVAVARLLRLGVGVEHNGWLARERREAGGSGRLAAFEEWAQVAASRLAHLTRSVTRGMAERLIAGGVDRDRVLALGNGCDVDQLRPLPRKEALSAFGLAEERTYLGFIGNIVPWHGLDTAIMAFAQVAREAPLADLIVFGDGPSRADLEALAVRLGLAGRVRFMGPVPIERAGLAINCFDIAILPLTERRDTAFGYSPVKIRDYAAAGRLILTGHVPDNTDLTGQGFLFTHKADDPADMARAVRDLLAARVTWPEAGRRSRAHAERHFAWPMIAARIAERLERAGEGRLRRR